VIASPRNRHAWEITHQELVDLELATEEILAHADRDASLLALANWAITLVDASAVAIAVRAAGEAEPIIRAAVGRRTRGWRGRPLAQIAIGRNWLTVPLVTDPALGGSVIARPRRGHAWVPGDEVVLKLLAAQASLALAQERTDVQLAVARAAEAASARERTRLARELHDSTAQQLVAVSRQMDVLQHRRGLGEAAAELVRIHDMIDDCLVEVRRISRDLRPSILEDLGLEAAIAAYVADVSRSTEMAISLHPEGRAMYLLPAHELALYRFAQEAVNNAVRHADAGRIQIDLRWGPDTVEIEVIDDGCGFAPPDTLAGLMRHGSLGLAGLADRIGEIGGALAIVSAPGQGTRLRAWLPISSVTMPRRDGREGEFGSPGVDSARRRA